MIFGIILLVVALILLLTTCLACEDEALLIVTGFLLGAFAFLGIIIICEETTQEKTEFKYPTTEYSLEYEVITRGEQIDSTYVITKIE